MTGEPKRENLTLDGYSKICDWMGCINESDEWYHIEVHCCNKGTIGTAVCKECINKMFEDDD